MRDNGFSQSNQGRHCYVSSEKYPGSCETCEPGKGHMWKGVHFVRELKIIKGDPISTVKVYCGEHCPIHSGRKEPSHVAG